MIKHEISSVEAGSIAEEMEISPGDFLLSINKEAVRDFLDYRFKTADEEFLVLEIEKGTGPEKGQIWELEIEKDGDESLGMEFKQSLMSDTRRCCNQCIFCFIDQQPPGLRDTLYVKDDDPRMSFLLGNYVTLTNLGAAEIKRLAGYRISPLRVSVHTADLDLREKMMGTKAARNLFRALDAFFAVGTEFHFQIVLCRGINDGAALDYTLEVLKRYGPKSLSIVPAGVTKYREGLAALEVFDKDSAARVIEQAAAFEDFVYLSDEWYLLAGLPLPGYKSYGDFPQLDNGVGVMRLFEREFKLALKKSEKAVQKHGKVVHIAVVTGTVAAGFMKARARDFMDVYPRAMITVYPIVNHFFGDTVTVSGLLTGGDIVAGLKFNPYNMPDVVLVPDNIFRAGVEDKIMLDGMTHATLADKIGVPVETVDVDGGAFCAILLEKLL